MKHSTDRILTTHVGRVHPQIVWAKLDALVKGAHIASKHIWG